MAGYKSKKKAAEDKAGWPKVVKGSHLTVTTHEDGRTELEWDHDQLQKDVLAALASVEKPVAKKSKSKSV